MQRKAEIFPLINNTRAQNKKLRVCAYARVSTDNEDQANSYNSQVSFFTDYIKQCNDWTFCGVYADEGISGTSTKKRADFNRMIADAQDGAFDLILTKEVSRFARNTVDTLQYKRMLKKIGVEIIFLTDGIDTRDNDGELRLSIMATIAQEESRKTSIRVKWGQKRRMEQGIVLGRDMLGYTVKGGKLYLNEDEAEIVRQIFHKFLDEEKGTTVIARELKEAGVNPKRVKNWSNTVILRVLRNEKYVGDLCQKKTITPDFLDHAKKYNRDADGNPIEDMVYIKDHHPDIAIIDRDTWDRTQAELKRRSPSAEQKAKHSNRYWCSGKIICGECGSRFVSRRKTLKNGTIYKAWRCYESATYGNPKIDADGQHVGCIGTSIGDRTLLYCVNAALNLVQDNKDKLIKELTDDMKALQAAPQKVSTEGLTSQIEELKKRKIRIIDLAASGAISPTDLKQQNAHYDSEIDRLNNQLSVAEQAGAIYEAQGKNLGRQISAIKEILSVDGTDEIVLRQAIEKVIVYTGNILVVYFNYIPFGVKLHYKTSGKMDLYKIEVDNLERVPVEG